MTDTEFRNFWSGFPDKNIFKNLIQFSQSRSALPDNIIFESVFGSPQFPLRARQKLIGPNWNDKRKFNIWYTGENLEPPKNYNLTLSFQIDSANNLYWPLWATYSKIDNLDFDIDREFLFDQSAFTRPRFMNLENKIPKACAFVSNPIEPRFSVYKELQVLGVLDLYGSAVGNPVKSKFEIANKYLFQLCFENIFAPGYITEKIFESYNCGNIPIYHDRNDDEYLNPESYIGIKVLNAKNIYEVISEFNNSKLETISRAPILKKKYNHGKLVDKIISLNSY